MRSSPLSRWQIVAIIGGLSVLTLLVVNRLQNRLAGHLVDKVIANQQMRIEWNVERFDRTLRLAETSVQRYAKLISYTTATLNSTSDSLEGIAQRDPDGAWRTPRTGFDPTTEAGVWIPPGVTLDAQTRRFFVRSRGITSLFGQGAEDPLIANTWVLPLVNGEVIFWPEDGAFIYNAKAGLDYRSTPWVQLTSPERNPQGKAIWTEPDYDPAARRWLISVVAPFRGNGVWAGSVGHDILLSTLLSDLVDDGGSGLMTPRAEAIASAPLYVARADGQLLARRGSEPHSGERLPAELLPFLQRSPGKGGVKVYRRGTDHVIVAPLPALKAWVVYVVEGQWIGRTLREEFTGLQVAEALFISLLLGSAVALAVRDAQFRQRQQSLLENRNRDLEQLVHDRTMELEDRTKELEMAGARLRQEVLLASQIQRDLLVSEREIHHSCEGLEVGVLMVPSKEVGGDLYDIIPLAGNRQVIAVGDVAGKGMPAALLMSTCLSLLRSYAEVLDSPAAIVRRLNQRLCQHNEGCAFTTMVVGVLDARNGELRWCNAGHVPLLILRGSSEAEPLRTVHGPALGVEEGVAYGESRINLGLHDMLVGCTDGATEMAERKGGRYGLPRLSSFLSEQPSQRPSRLVRALMRELRQYAAGEPQRDDITLLALRRRSPEGEKLADAMALQLEVCGESGLGMTKQEVRSWCRNQNVAEPDQRRLLVVIDELVNNVIRHGGKGERAQIRLRMDRRPETIALQLEDDGVPFNPLTWPEPTHPELIEDRPVGGLGIMLARKLSENWDYQRLGEWNRSQLQIQLG